MRAPVIPALSSLAIVVGLSAQTATGPRAGVDWPGVVTFSTSLFLLVFALVRGNAEGWSSFPITGSLIGAVVLMFAAIVPSTRLKTLVAGLIAVSMNPMAMLIARQMSLQNGHRSV